MKKAQEDGKRKKLSNRKLQYGVFLATITCLVFLLSYYFFIMPRSSDAWKSAIVDQLSIEENCESYSFVANCTSLLNNSGFSVEYVEGEEVTIDFYENSLSKGGKIVILRAHSAIRQNTNSVDLFTSEIYQESLASGQYSHLVEYRHISKAVFDVPPYNEYFAVGPSFVESIMKGNFNNSLIILMGCDSLNKTTIAEALVARGAKVVIGWTRRVSLNDTDTSTLQLLKYLLAENPYTIEGAVERLNRYDYFYGAKLDYYPKNDETRYYKLPTKNVKTSSDVPGQHYAEILMLPVPVNRKGFCSITF